MAEIITNLKPVLEELKPDFIYSNTSTSMAASMSAFYAGAKVCHVEPDLRTFNKRSPFPEEFNRSITGCIADYHFSPTVASQQNLLNKNIQTENILVTANTVIDALNFRIEKVHSKNFNDQEIEMLKSIIDPSKRVILVTGHRRENHGQGFINICKALKEITVQNKNTQIIHPVHLNPNVQKPVYELLTDLKNIELINP